MPKRQSKVILDDYEKDIENHLGKQKSLSKQAKQKAIKTLHQAADNYLKKNKRISIRVYGSDLQQLKMMAANEGLPYQTLITSILHKYITGQLVQKHKL